MDTKIRPIYIYTHTHTHTHTYTYILPTGDALQNQRHIQTESKRLEKILYANGKQKKAGVTILISDK